MIKRWAVYEGISIEQISQLRVAKISVDINTEPQIIQIASVTGMQEVLLPNLGEGYLFTNSEQQETLLSLMFGDKVKFLMYENEQQYY